jgi:pimeloyl-ACP methyl ester carboxylesterase
MSSADYWFDSHDGLRLYSQVFAGPEAASPVVLCLHGLMRTGRDFDDLAEHLARRYRIIVPDVRGRGRSARDVHFSNYQIPVYARDVRTLLEGLGAARVSVIGTSMGGLIGMMLAMTQPQLIERLVLNDVGPEIDPRGLERILSYVGKVPPVSSWPEAIAQMRSLYGSAWPDLSDARWEKIARVTYRVNAAGAPEVDADPMIGAAAGAAPGAAPSLWPLWSALAGVPVLAIRGAHSDILSAATLERMQRTKPDLKAVTVPNRGHAPLLDEPECLAAIDEFLATPRSGAVGTARAGFWLRKWLQLSAWAGQFGWRV